MFVVALPGVLAGAETTFRDEWTSSEDCRDKIVGQPAALPCTSVLHSITEIIGQCNDESCRIHVNATGYGLTRTPGLLELATYVIIIDWRDSGAQVQVCPAWPYDHAPVVRDIECARVCSYTTVGWQVGCSAFREYNVPSVPNSCKISIMVQTVMDHDMVDFNGATVVYDVCQGDDHTAYLRKWGSPNG